MSLSSSDLVVEAQKNVSDEVLMQEKKTSKELKTHLRPQHGRSDRRLPTLPVEVIERILKYTFLRPSRLTPSSDPFPLVGSSHLLLVSKGFRELCLPIFFQSITISRSSHWITFFDSEHGLFAGEEGRKRWSFVKEAAVVFGVQPPIPHPPQEPNVYVVPLEVPSSQVPLDALCLLGGKKSMHTSTEDLNGVMGVLHLSLNFSQAELDALPDEEQTQANRDYQEMLDEAFGEMLEQRRMCLVNEVLGNGRPLELRLSLDAMRHCQSEAGGRPQGSYGSLHVFPNSKPSDSFDSRSLTILVNRAQDYHGSTSRVHLEGFDATFLREHFKWLGKKGKGYVASRVSWSWDLEDGSHVVVDAAAADQEAN